MKKRDVAQIGLLTLLVVAVMALALYSEQSRKRSMANIEAICEQFEALTDRPCVLKLPPSGIADGDKRTDRGEVMLAKKASMKAPIGGCPVMGNITSRGARIYHGPDSPYRSMVAPEQCFRTEAEARAAGFRAPG